MANTYYDSQLTAEEIEEVLEAIYGILTQANNGKVLAINNGKIEARSVQWGGGSAVVQPLSVTQNGAYNPPSGVDGYAPVTVNVSGGGPIEEWNFKESFIGEERGIEISATNVVRDSSGAIFDSTNDYLTIPIRLPVCTIEIDVGAMSLTSGTHRRFVMAGSESGLIYRSNGKWSFYAGSWATDSDISDGAYFDNSTVKIVVDSSGYWHIYKDNVLVYEPNKALSFNMTYITIGASSSSINNVILNGMRIY